MAYNPLAPYLIASGRANPLQLDTLSDVALSSSNPTDALNRQVQTSSYGGLPTYASLSGGVSPNDAAYQLMMRNPGTTYAQAQGQAAPQPTGIVGGTSGNGTANRAIGGTGSSLTSNIISELGLGQELSGVLPADVRNQIYQSAAERGIATGTSGSPNNDAALLRAIGLTSQGIRDKALSSVLPLYGSEMGEQYAGQRQAADSAAASGRLSMQLTSQEKQQATELASRGAIANLENEAALNRLNTQLTAQDRQQAAELASRLVLARMQEEAAAGRLNDQLASQIQQQASEIAARYGLQQLQAQTEYKLQDMRSENQLQSQLLNIYGNDLYGNIGSRTAWPT